jgi:hypothetical protein
MSDAARSVQTIEQVAALAMQLGSRHLAVWLTMGPTPAVTTLPSANSWPA